MARGTTPPGQMGEEARSGYADGVAGAENAEGITPEMRKGPETKSGLDAGPEQGSRGEYLPRAYQLPKRPRATKGFIRVDR